MDASARSDAGDAGEPAAPTPGEEASGDSPFASDAGATLLNGTAPPALGADAPKSVVFGVILVAYKGAQGAPPNARTRDAAGRFRKTRRLQRIVGPEGHVMPRLDQTPRHRRAHDSQS